MAPMNALSPVPFPPSMDPSSIPSLPHNLEAEQALLGSLMFDNAVFERLSDRLRGAHFYEPFHQRLYEAIEDPIRQGMLAEPTILMERFKQDPAFQEFGGLRYFADLVDRAPPAANAPDYARVVYDTALRRDLIRIGGGGDNQGGAQPGAARRRTDRTGGTDPVFARRDRQAVVRFRQLFPRPVRRRSDGGRSLSARRQAGRVGDRIERSGSETGRVAPLRPADPRSEEH